MIRKKKPWFSYRLIVPALIVLPPLGLVLLWKSPRTRRAKMVASMLFLVFLTTGFVGAVKSGMYERYILAKQPTGDVYDVRMSSRQAFISREILPFERKIFSAVVGKLRTNETDPDLNRDIVDIESISAEIRACQAVGEEYGIDYDDVQKMYRKVASLMLKSK